MDIAQENRASTNDEDYGPHPKLSVEARRELIRQSLPGLASEITMLMRDAELNFPIFLCLPRSGSALVTLASPLDPPASEWTEATKVLFEVISRILGGIKLCGRDLNHERVRCNYGCW